MDTQRRNGSPRRPLPRPWLLRLGLLTVAGACACAGPSGTKLTQITSDPAADLLPPGSTVTAMRRDDLHGSISGKQRAALSREVTSASSCSRVSGYYRAELPGRGWVQNGGVNHFENDIDNLAGPRRRCALGLPLKALRLSRPVPRPSQFRRVAASSGSTSKGPDRRKPSLIDPERRRSVEARGRSCPLETSALRVPIKAPCGA